MRLYLVNPSNPLVSLTRVKDNHWNQYRVWKPLSLLVIAGLTPLDWDITVVDENLGKPSYSTMPLPDLVGITAFTSQADRAYRVAAWFRSRGVPVVIGGIHATMRLEEAMERVDAVVTGEAENVWSEVLEDVLRGDLKRVYHGSFVDMSKVRPARHDLLRNGYRFGSIQTTRGCPLNCSFCSVTAFNGRRYRHRPVEHVVEEFKAIPENNVLVVDDNLIGTRKDHIARSKGLFQAMIKADLRKRWIAQATINMADDEELLGLAAKAGCLGVFIGFESPTVEGLVEIHKKFNIQEGRNFRASVRRMQRHGIMVVGAFIMGLDSDERGIGRQIADAANHYEVDFLNVLFMTPLPGTELWAKMESERRIVVDAFPEDWKYYTLGHPVATYKHLSWSAMLDEVTTCYRNFYAYRRMLGRTVRTLLRTRKPITALASLAANFSYSRNLRLDFQNYNALDLARGDALDSIRPRGGHRIPSRVEGGGIIDREYRNTAPGTSSGKTKDAEAPSS